MQILKQDKVLYTGLFAFLSLVFAIYYPGLDGWFFFDDFPNLGTLDLIEKNGYLHYIFGGISGPSGRPISLLSFALQHQDWPNNPFSFKLVNLIIHLVNGILVFYICRYLVIPLNLKVREQKALCFIATALWLVHPIQVSTVLYVVQRMTELSAFFVLLGLLLYLYGRTLYKAGTYKQALLIMSSAVVFGTLLGILSKENGILLPLYIIAIEYSLYSKEKKDQLWLVWSKIFLLLPLVILIIYLASTFGDVLWNYQNRSFTVTERLMTQPKILFEYIQRIMIPRVGQYSLFHDDYVFSTGILNPPVTAIYIIGLLSIFVFSIFIRKKYSVISFSIFWFLAGHALESSYLNLELYFEHRNYLPSIGLFLLIGWLMIKISGKFKINMVVNFTFAIYMICVLSITIMEIRLWGNPARQAIDWSRTHPKSIRAIDNLGSILLLTKEYGKARELYSRIKLINVNDLYPDTKNISITYCLEEREFTEQQWQVTINKARDAKLYGFAPLSELDTLIRTILKGECYVSQANRIIELLMMIAKNNEFERYQHFIYELVANLATYTGNHKLALDSINRSIRIEKMPQKYVLKIRILNALQMRDELIITINDFDNLLSRNPKYRLGFGTIIEKFKSDIERK